MISRVDQEAEAKIAEKDSGPSGIYIIDSDCIEAR